MIVNSISFKASNGTSNLQNKPAKHNSQSSTKNNLKKAIPYVAGLTILAVSGYAFRGKIAKILKKAPDVQPQPKTKPKVKPQPKAKPADDIPKPVETPNLPAIIYPGIIKSENSKPVFQPGPELRAQITGEKPFHFNIKPLKPKETPEVTEKPSVIIEKLSDETDTTKNICTGFDKNKKPVYEKVEMPVQIPGLTSIYKETLDIIDLNKPSVISKIEKIRAQEQNDITRILNENTHDGHIDIQMMKKIAMDYMNDLNRGETRFHQAADLLEQAHIKEYLRGDSTMRSGIYNLTDSILTDPVLYRCYQNMPVEESAVRLNYIKENYVKSASYKEGLDADGFFEKTFARLVDKYQMKKYNQAHNIEA